MRLISTSSFLSFLLRGLVPALLLCALVLAAAPVRAATAAEQFSLAYKDFHALAKDSKRAKFRHEWDKVADTFDEILKKNPKSGVAPKCLFYLGRVQEELGDRSGNDKDYAKALDYYAQFVKRYPRHGWADDCLYRSAELRINRLDQTAQGREDLETLLKRHPKGDQAAKARKLLAQTPAPKAAPAAPKAQASASKAPAPAKPAPRPAPAPAAAEPETPAHESPAAIKGRPAGSGRAVLGEVRYTSSDDYTRVILDVSGEVKYRYQLLPPAPEVGRPHRLYVDLAETAVGKGVPPQVKVSDGILRSIRSGQKDPDTTRVVIDFQELQEYKVFPLSDPYRLVIDVYASAKEEKPVRATLKPEPEDEPEPAPAKKSRKGSPIKPLKLKGSKSMANNLIEQLGLTIDTIMIDPGHGGKDGGAVANGLREKDVNLQFAKILGRKLKDQGFNVLYTRTTDIFIPLEKRTAMANARKADIFISIHCNANTDSRVNGLETYTLNLARTEDAVRVAARENAVDAKRISDLQFILTDLMLNSKMKESTDLAKGVQREVVKSVRSNWELRDHGVREAPFYVLMGAKMPAVLVELGYVTNKAEASRLKSDYYLKYLADGIVEGVLAYKHQIERYAMSKF
ncbi:N-acetylmuramoyl-L-alanine amidase [Desulfovibrio aminophilus]|nr:N-acetylmuramoyl-L-alanine amidase [Desulfovibrio aminophilus]MCM0755746.1 N-acetylmuramoyl-L-alanine amidase [Desulfovibrio aminophilus]